MKTKIFKPDEMILQVGDKVKFTTGIVGEFIEYLPKRAKLKVTDLEGKTKIVIKKLNQIKEYINESSEQSISDFSEA